MKTLTAVSLFTCGGIGDIAIRDAGYDIVLSNELVPERHEVFAFNFPDAVALTGDIWKQQSTLIDTATRLLDGDAPTLLYATPPCQGMSKNGRGKLLNGIRSGSKNLHDDRNQLIVPTIRIAKALNPEVVLLENVPEMESTAIPDESGKLVGIIDFVRRELGQDYEGTAEVVEFADYGVPQCRQRLITVFSRNAKMKRWLREFGTLLPPQTHSRDGAQGTSPWVTLRDVISDLPPLDAATPEEARSEIPFHRVPLLDSTKYWWVSNTPPECCAFDNQCINCGHTSNPTHSSRHDSAGINRASRETPLHCLRCGGLLPRPSVETDGQLRLMRGFTSAYKRMSFDRPASALTRNLSYACSDNKLHPEQNRVLSLFEAFRVHTLDQFDYQWRRKDGKAVSDKLVRELLGESIPPLGLRKIVSHITRILSDATNASDEPQLGGLFAVSRRE